MQKKILPLFLSVVIISFSAGAQITKGALLLGGQLSFSTQQYENSFPNTASFSSSVINISPAFGKAIKENLIIGADLIFSHSKYQPSAAQEQVSNTYGAGFFVRTYKVLGKGFCLFGQARIGGSTGKQQSTDLQTQLNTGTVNTLYVQLSLYPGVSYSLNKKLQVEAGFNNLALIGYQHTKQTSPPNNFIYSNNSFTASSSLSSFAGPTIGFQVLLN